jgi:UDP-2-acetamido-3-amino-2,3-dideoxy-glucuronate N-acetyltransferase
MSAHLKSLALIGAGQWGKNLARVYAELGVLHTVCDLNEQLLESYHSLYPSIKLTRHFQLVLDDPQITKVAIAAPAALHYTLAKQTLQAGKDIFVEKPLCLDFQQAEELIHLAEEKGRILMVGHLLQYHPCIGALQELVGRGELGKLHYIVSNRLNLGSIRTAENALWSFAPHDLSVILSLTNHRLPKQLRCTGSACLSPPIADTTLTTLEFEDLKAHIYVSWLHPFKEQKLVVVGSSGMAVFDDTLPWEEKLLLYRNPVTWSQGQIPQANKCAAEKIVVPPSEPLRNECEHFLACCEQRTIPRTDGHEGLRVLKVLQAAQASLNENGEAKSPHPNPAYFVHSSAIIDEGASVGEGTKIWHFSHIMSGAQIGPHCTLGQNVMVSSGVILGKNVKVQNNVSLYAGVICEDDVFLGPSVVFTNVINPRSAIDRRTEFQKTVLRKGATIGANATLLCGNELGAYCFIGAGAVVTRPVKPFALVVGNPGQHIGWMSRFGARLPLPVALPPGEEMEVSCPSTREIYRLCGDTLTCCERVLV